MSHFWASNSSSRRLVGITRDQRDRLRPHIKMAPLNGQGVGLVGSNGYVAAKKL